VHVCRGERTRVSACVVKSTCATGSERKRVTYADGLGVSKRASGATERHGCLSVSETASQFTTVEMCAPVCW
jgi:hypothetical protein